VPSELSDVADLLRVGYSELNIAYCLGEESAYERARAIFAEAETACQDRPALLWWLARLYADLGFFADSAAALSALLTARPGNA